MMESNCQPTACNADEKEDEPWLYGKVFTKKHTRYFQRFLTSIPHQMQSCETQVPLIMYFSVSALDMINQKSTIDAPLSCSQKNNIASFIFEHQVSEQALIGGFRGGRLSYLPSHLAMTYTSLCILRITGHLQDTRLHTLHILATLKHLQVKDGSFRSCHVEDDDVRFCYCACAIAYMLSPSSSMVTQHFDASALLIYLLNCQSYEGGFGCKPNSECHGGHTFCVLACFRLLSKEDSDGLTPMVNLLSSVVPRCEAQRRLKKCRNWLMQRQQSDAMEEEGELLGKGGFNGRSNKFPDSCYSFWIGASLKLLGDDRFIDLNSLHNFLRSECEGEFGGFFKDSINAVADPLHSYTSISALFMPGIHAALNIRASTK